MSRNWHLEVDLSGKKENRYIRLVLKPSSGGDVVQVSKDCFDLQCFKEEVRVIKAELDNLLTQAARKWQEMEKIPEEEPASADEIWDKMTSFSSDQEMFDFFNSLDEEKRKEVAEFVFTQVNMFKGKGPVFAEHFNAHSSMLE